MARICPWFTDVEQLKNLYHCIERVSEIECCF
nr:unnamed protein product [Callosobruchus analis]